MAEEGNVAAPTETPPAPDTVALIDNEGNFREGWTSILDEDLRGNSFLNENKTIQGMARSVVSARGMVGRDKIPIPTEASSEAEWDAFHKAGGRPETAADYGFARPKDFPEEFYSEDFATAAQELCHKIGLSKKQALALFEFNNSYTMQLVKANAANDELETTKLKDGLYSDWGNAFEQKKHLGNVAIEQGANGNEEFKARLVEKFGNDPDFIRFSSNLGSKFAESTSPDAAMIPTPGVIKEQIATEMSNKAYGADYAKHGFTRTQHRDQVEKVAALYREQTKHIKTG
jgi:hypothetical protein